MKKSIKETQNVEVTGSVTSKSRKKKWLIIVIVVVILAAAAVGGYLLYRAHHHKPLTKEQQAAQNTVPSLQTYTAQQQQQRVPNDIRAGTMANLAIAEAVAGQCKEANRDLTEAQKLAPPASAQEMTAAQKQVKNYCR